MHILMFYENKLQHTGTTYIMPPLKHSVGKVMILNSFAVTVRFTVVSFVLKNILLSNAKPYVWQGEDQRKPGQGSDYLI